jgi:hypothetical protein
VADDPVGVDRRGDAVWWWLRTHDLSFYGAFQAFAAGGTVFMLIFLAP